VPSTAGHEVGEERSGYAELYAVRCNLILIAS